MHRIADRMGGDVVLADRAQDKPGARPVEEPADREHHDQREIDERAVAEQHPADGVAGQQSGNSLIEGRDRPCRRSPRRSATRGRCRRSPAQGRSRPGWSRASARERQTASRRPRRRAPLRPRRPRAPSRRARRRNSKVTAKPVTAPISIMPSTPRLRTPLFSTTSSPVAASRIGVVTPMTVTRASMRNRDVHARAPAAATRGASRTTRSR